MGGGRHSGMAEEGRGSLAVGILGGREGWAATVSIWSCVGCFERRDPKLLLAAYVGCGGGEVGGV